MRRAGRLNGLQPDEAADAVIDMDDDVAGRKRSGLRDEIGRALLAFRTPDQAIAEDVLLGDDDQFVRLEAGFQLQDGEPRLPCFKSGDVG